MLQVCICYNTAYCKCAFTESGHVLHTSYILDVRTCFKCIFTAMQHTASAHLLHIAHIMQVRTCFTCADPFLPACAANAHKYSIYCIFRMFAHASSLHSLQHSILQLRTASAHLLHISCILHVRTCFKCDCNTAYCKCAFTTYMAHSASSHMLHMRIYCNPAYSCT